MSLDRTDLNANNPNTASLAPGESPQALVPRDSDKYSDTTRNRSNKKEESRSASMSVPPGPSPSQAAPAVTSGSAPVMPSTQDNNHRDNTPLSDNKNANDREKIVREFIEKVCQQVLRRHLLLGHRQAPFTGTADTYDYTKIFEEDEPYTEMSPFARVWMVYNQELAKLDSDRIDDWRDGLDSLLVFAALFSAVITTFVAQTSTSLKPDWGEVTANLLVELILVQRAGLNGTSVNSIPSSQLTPSSTFTPRPLDVTVNALWFFSLALSLSTALAAILCKQWIHQYTIMPSTNSPQERAQVHYFRFMGLEKWHVAGIIGLLPTFVHLSLGVFFVGLIIFLHDLSLIIGVIVDIVIAFTIGSYTIMNFLPVWFTECPYKTPLTSYAFSAMWALYHVIGKKLANFQLPDSLHKETSLASLEKSTTTSQGPSINCGILSWLVASSSNSSVRSIAIEALGNLPPCQISIFKEKLPPDFRLDETLHHHALQSTSVSESSYGRAIRALVRVMKVNSNPNPYQNLFPIPNSSKSLVLKPQHDILYSDGEKKYTSSMLDFIFNALNDSGDEIKCEPVLWCFYFDFLESTWRPEFLYEHSQKLDKDILWNIAQLVSSTMSIDGLKRSSFYEKLRWTQFMLGLPTNLDESQKYGFKEMTSPCTIWEFFRTYPAAASFLLQHILPLSVKKDLNLSALADIPDYLHLLHHVAITPEAWQKHPDILSAVMSKLVELASMEGEEDQKKALEVLVVTWTWILLSVRISDDDMMHADWYTIEGLLDKSFNTLHIFGKDPTELITKVVIRGIAAATRISDSNRAEQLAWNCFRIVLQKYPSPQWIPPLWKTLTEEKVLSLSVERMDWLTRKCLYELQQKYLSGLASLQKKSPSEGEEVFREEAIAYISGEKTEPLTSLLRSSFFRHDLPRKVPDLQEALRCLKWLAQLKNPENEHANRILKEKWLPCLEQVENELSEGEQKVVIVEWEKVRINEWEKEQYRQTLKILRDFRKYITGDTTLPPSQQMTDWQSSRSSISQGSKTKRSKWPFRFRLRRPKREPDEETGLKTWTPLQRRVDARNFEWEQSGTDTPRDNGSNAGDGNETTSADRGEVEAGSSRAEDSGRGQTEGQSDTGEVVGTEQSQTPDKQGDHLSDVPAGDETAGGGNEDASEVEGNMDKSADSQLMDNRSGAESDRTEGKKEGTETGVVAEDGTSTPEGYEDDGTKDGTRRESRSEPTSSAGESGVDEVGNQGTDTTEQHVARRTGGLDEGDNLDLGGSTGSGALQEEVSGDDGIQTAATGMLSTASSRKDEDPKVDNNNDNQATNVQSQTGRTDREGESLHTRDSPEDGSKDDATHAGSRVEIAGGTDIIGDSGPEAEGRVNEVVSGTANDIEDSEREESGPNTLTNRVTKSLFLAASESFLHNTSRNHCVIYSPLNSFLSFLRVYIIQQSTTLEHSPDSATPSICCLLTNCVINVILPSISVASLRVQILQPLSTRT